MGLGDLLGLALLSLVAGAAASGGLLDAQGFDLGEARRFASLSSATYCDKNISRVLDWSCNACSDSGIRLVPGKIQVVDSGKDNASRIVIGKLADQHGCLVAFRGSDNVQNWIRNFEFWQISPFEPFEDCQGCRVHSGFYTIWKNVKRQVLDAISEVGCGQYNPLNESSSPDNLLYITGHSLGAALTHLAMFTLSNAGWNISKTYSYEAPRIGNKAFSDNFAQRFVRKVPVFRVTHNEDPVVHLPPEDFGFYHVPTEVYFDKQANHTICDYPEDSACADQFWNLPAMLLLHIGDHCGSPLLPNGDFCNPTDC